MLTAGQLMGVGRQPTRSPPLLRNIFLPSPCPWPPVRPFNGCRGQGGQHGSGKLCGSRAHSAAAAWRCSQDLSLKCLQSTNALLCHRPGFVKLPANAEHKLVKCCVSLSCPITMLLSYLFAQFPVGHWWDIYKVSEALSLARGWGVGAGLLPAVHRDVTICAHNCLTRSQDKTSHGCSFSPWMETFSQTVIIFHPCYCEMTRLLPPLSFQKTVLLSQFTNNKKS